MPARFLRKNGKPRGGFVRAGCGCASATGDVQNFKWTVEDAGPYTAFVRSREFSQNQSLENFRKTYR